MKTSNKILLGAFFTTLLIIVSLHIALYAKYKKGEYTLLKDEMWPTNMITHSLSDVKYVSIANVENVTIEAADSSKLEYEKPGEGDENVLDVTKRADTLFLLGKGRRNTNGSWYRGTHLSLAGVLPLRIINSQVHVRDAKNSNPAVFDITLDDSYMEVNNHQNSAISFTTLKINATNKSRVNLFNVRAGFLDVKLKNSSLEETTLAADSIRIVTDQESELQLSGKNLLKTKIGTYE